MKRLIVATTMLIAAVSTSAWAQAPAGDDPHHATQGTTAAGEQAKAPAATQSQTPNAPQSIERDLMKDMQAMPAHDHANDDACCTLKKPNHAQ